MRSNTINIIPPEIMTEQIFSYSVQSYEALKSAKRKIDSGYNFVFIPKGSHIYTGILQTTGYLVLSPAKKDIFIISDQDTHPDKIEIYNQKIGPILGVYFDGLELESKGNIFSQIKEIPDELEFQLNMSRIIQDSQKYIYIGIGKNVQEKELKNLIKILDKNKNHCNFVFLGNLSENLEIKKCKTQDTKIIEKIVMKEINNEYIKSNNILKTYLQCTQNSENIPEVIMYANSGDLDGNTKKTNGYVCLAF